MSLTWVCLQVFLRVRAHENKMSKSNTQRCDSEFSQMKKKGVIEVGTHEFMMMMCVYSRCACERVTDM